MTGDQIRLAQQSRSTVAHYRYIIVLKAYLLLMGDQIRLVPQGRSTVAYYRYIMATGWLQTIQQIATGWLQTTQQIATGWLQIIFNLNSSQATLYI